MQQVASFSTIVAIGTVTTCLIGVVAPDEVCQRISNGLHPVIVMFCVAQR